MRTRDSHFRPEQDQRPLDRHAACGLHQPRYSLNGGPGGTPTAAWPLVPIAFDPSHFANVAFSDDHKLSPVTIAGHAGYDDPGRAG